MRRHRILGSCLASLMLIGTTALPTQTQQTHAATMTGLHVSGNQLVNASGQPVRLLGVDRSGAEYSCLSRGTFDGPTDAASVQAISFWHANAVRVPLNEDCWLGINGLQPGTSGSAYQQAIAAFVNLLTQSGLAVILDLHWNAPGSSIARRQQPMPDQDHAPAFWASVASTFKANSAVIFDLYNEPYPDSNQDSAAAWRCWRDGGTCPGVSFPVAGMQELMMTVPNAGAPNVLALGGVQYANALSQ